MIIALKYRANINSINIAGNILERKYFLVGDRFRARVIMPNMQLAAKRASLRLVAVSWRGWWLERK